MTSKEIGAMIRSLRDGKEVICPECKKGKIVTPYHSFFGVSGIFIPIFKKGKVKRYDESNVKSANGRKNR